MSKNNYIRTSYPKEMYDEITRILLDCKKLGIFLKSRKQACLLAVEKSRRNIMTREEIIDFLNRLEKNL